MKDVVSAILGGGQGTRLWPLTRHRAKPAVPLGGKFRLIDIPISNSLHAGISRMFVMTQFASAGLHRHIAETYRFDSFHGGFVGILAADQNLDNRDWYQGTADAVRQNLVWLNESGSRGVVILSGDQLYLMNIREFVTLHRRTNADLTIAVTPVSRADARGLGIMRVDDEGRIVAFVEKPQDDATLDELTPDAATLARLGFPARPGTLLASMGIYVFHARALNELLTGTTATDFGREVIPGAIHERRVMAYAYDGYWRDIGTIPSFHEASLDLTRPLPPLNLYSSQFPIYTHPRFLPGAKVNGCRVSQSVLCEGSIISDSRISDSIVGIRAVVREGAVLERTVLMGAAYFENPGHADGHVPLGVGRDCRLRNVIVDLNTSIGDGSVLTNERGVQNHDAENYCIRGGVIVVPQGAVIEPGTVV